MVAHELPKLGVASSSLVARSKNEDPREYAPGGLVFLPPARHAAYALSRAGGISTIEAGPSAPTLTMSRRPWKGPSVVR